VEKRAKGVGQRDQPTNNLINLSKMQTLLTGPKEKAKENRTNKKEKGKQTKAMAVIPSFCLRARLTVLLKFQLNIFLFLSTRTPQNTQNTGNAVLMCFNYCFYNYYNYDCETANPRTSGGFRRQQQRSLGNLRRKLGEKCGALDFTVEETLRGHFARKCLIIENAWLRKTKWGNAEMCAEKGESRGMPMVAETTKICLRDFLHLCLCVTLSHMENPGK